MSSNKVGFGGEELERLGFLRAMALGGAALSSGGVTTGKKVEEGNTVASTAYCFVKGKVIMLAAYRQFTSPQDLKAARNIADSWANALIASN